jgi:hypothetical protein
MHDSLIYEVPQAKADAFVGVARPILSRRPDWAEATLIPSPGKAAFLL